MWVTPPPTPRRKAMDTSTSHDARWWSETPNNHPRGLAYRPLSSENRT
jgi:hypothetical protein